METRAIGKRSMRADLGMDLTVHELPNGMGWVQVDEGDPEEGRNALVYSMDATEEDKLALDTIALGYGLAVMPWWECDPDISDEERLVRHWLVRISQEVQAA